MSDDLVIVIFVDVNHIDDCSEDGVRVVVFTGAPVFVESKLFFIVGIMWQIVVSGVFENHEFGFEYVSQWHWRFRDTVVVSGFVDEFFAYFFDQVFEFESIE